MAFFCLFYLYIAEKNVNQINVKFNSLLKGEVTEKFERFNLAFLSWREGDQLNIVTQVVGLIRWWPYQLFWGFRYSHFCSSPLQNWSGSTAHHYEYFFSSLFCWWLCNHKSCVTAWKVSWWYFIKSLYNNAHIYIHTHIHTYLHIHT